MQAVVVRTAAWEVDRAGSIPIAAAIATATAVGASGIGGRMDDGGGEPNHIALDREPRWLLDEVIEGKRAAACRRRYSPI